MWDFLVWQTSIEWKVRQKSQDEQDEKKKLKIKNINENRFRFDEDLRSFNKRWLWTQIMLISQRTKNICFLTKSKMFGMNRHRDRCTDTYKEWAKKQSNIDKMICIP